MKGKMKYIVDKIVHGEVATSELENFDIVKVGKDEYSVIEDSTSYNIKLLDFNLETKIYNISVNDELFRVELKDELDQLIEKLGFELNEQTAESKLFSPMPGLVLEIFVKEGQEVKAGDKLLILEAMKMENVIKAKHDAVVKTVHINSGQAIEKNQLLIEME